MYPVRVWDFNVKFQDPLKPTRTVIVIDHVQEESGLVGRVEAGSKLTSINDHVFNDCSFDVRPILSRI